MAHVGIHRLAAGHREEGGAEHGEADVEILMQQELEPHRAGSAPRAPTGALKMPWMPSAAITANHPNITGPKIRPMKLVPFFCMTNRPTRMTTVSGMTAGASDGASTFSPSIAESTEIAGVIAPSP